MIMISARERDNMTCSHDKEESADGHGSMRFVIRQTPFEDMKPCTMSSSVALLLVLYDCCSVDFFSSYSWFFFVMLTDADIRFSIPAASTQLLDAVYVHRL